MIEDRDFRSGYLPPLCLRFSAKEREADTKVDTCIRFVSALLYLEWGLEVTNPIVSIPTF
jgi:hypothetical protein